MKKDIEWLKEQVKGEYEYNREKHNKEGFEGYAHREFVFKYVLGLIDQLDEPEVLSLDWISDNAVVGQYPVGIGYVVPAYKLQKLLVPEQEEVDRAYKDGYEKGKQHATERQSEETETVAGVLVDYLIASAKLKLALKMEVEELEE